MSRKGRRLSPEEEKLWQRIVDTTTPLETRIPFVKADRKSQTLPKATNAQKFQIGERGQLRRADTKIISPPTPLRMDRKLFTRLKRGKANPEARIDLHGMTADQAHRALLAFLFRCDADGKRLALVITGKGIRSDENDPVPQPQGVLRRQLPHWLEQPPLNQIVLQVTQAHQRHGGSGAFYVYLRR